MGFGDFSGDFRDIHGMMSYVRCSEEVEGLLEVISDIFMSREVMLFKLSDLMLLMVFLSIGSGSKFSALMLLFILNL